MNAITRYPVVRLIPCIVSPEFRDSWNVWSLSAESEFISDIGIVIKHTLELGLNIHSDIDQHCQSALDCIQRTGPVQPFSCRAKNIVLS